jgi:membrane associated rhomboid family serine protease
VIPLHDDNPTELFPIVTITLIVTCALIFFWQTSLDPRIQQAIVVSLGVIPATLVGSQQLPPELALIPPSATLISSMFLHGGWMHMLGNMLYLWIFGNNVEDAMGHGRFVVFYLLCGIAAALAQSLPDPASTVPMIGASGAIAGVLGAYLLLHPRARVLVAIPIGFFVTAARLPAVFVLGLWFLLQIISTFLTTGSTGGVAWGAHVGGFIAGVVLIPVFKRRGIRLFSQAHKTSA